VASLVNDFNSTIILAGATLAEGTTTIVLTVTDNKGNKILVALMLLLMNILEFPFNLQMAFPFTRTR